MDLNLLGPSTSNSTLSDGIIFQETSRVNAVTEIGSQLNDLFNDPEYSQELFDLQRNLQDLIAPHLPQLNRFRNFLTIMQPFINRKFLTQLSQNDLQMEGIMISAQIASVLPDLTPRIMEWIKQNIPVSFDQFKKFGAPEEDNNKDKDSEV